MGKKLLISMGVAAIAIIGCDVSHVEDDTTAANLATAARLNNEMSSAQTILAELKRLDPSVTDVYFKGTPENRIIAVARKNEYGEIVVSEFPYNQVASGSGAAPQQAASGGSDTGTMLMSGALGAMAGYMLANAAMSTSRPPVSSSTYNNVRQQEHRAYSSAAASSYRNNYTRKLRNDRAVAQQRIVQQQQQAAQTAGRSSGGSFKPSTPSRSYSSTPRPSFSGGARGGSSS